MSLFFNDEFDRRLSIFNGIVSEMQEKYQDPHLKKDDGSFYNLSEIYHIRTNDNGDLGIGIRDGYLPDFIQSELTDAFKATFSE